MPTSPEDTEREAEIEFRHNFRAYFLALTEAVMDLGRSPDGATIAIHHGAAARAAANLSGVLIALSNEIDAAGKQAILAAAVAEIHKGFDVSTAAGPCPSLPAIPAKEQRH